jgi:hypothetical protein
MDILRDLQHLVVQRIKLTRYEVQDGVKHRASAAAICAGGVVCWLLAGFDLCLTFAHLLHWSTSPLGSDPAQMPLWACHAVVTASLAVIGAILVQVGRVKYRSLAPIQFSTKDIIP